MLFPPSVSTQRLSPCMVLCSLSHSTFVCILCCFRFPRGQLANKPLSSALYMVRLSPKVTSRCIQRIFSPILTPIEWIDISQLRCALRQQLQLGKNPTLLAREGADTAAFSLAACQLATAHVASVSFGLTWSHFWSMPSRHGCLVCVSPCVTGMSNTAKRLRNSRLCVDLQAHQLLCNNLQHLWIATGSSGNVLVGNSPVPLAWLTCSVWSFVSSRRV